MKYRDLPTRQSDVKRRWVLILEIIAIVPVYILAIFPGLYSIKNMNVWFRLNKAIYLLLLLKSCDKAISSYVAKKKIFFIYARVFRFTISTLVVLHWMSCIWLTYADTSNIDNYSEDEHRNWLNQMSPKYITIETWKENPLYAYLLSFYFVTVTMTTTGYGDITPVTTSEIRFCSFLILLGDMIMALAAGAFIQYVSTLNQTTLDLQIKERAIQSYLKHRSKVIIQRSEDIVYNDDVNNSKKNKYAITEEDLISQRHSFAQLSKRIAKYFDMQLEFQHRVGTINHLIRYLPEYYKTKLLHSLFERFFKRYPFLYQNKDLYLQLLENLSEEIYTFHDHPTRPTWQYIVDPQVSKIDDFLIVQFGECEVYQRKEWAKFMFKKKSQGYDEQRGEEINNLRRPKAIIKKSGDLIGFRSFVLKKASRIVARPLPPYNSLLMSGGKEQTKNYSIVSILRITRTKWKAILDNVLTREEKLALKKAVATGPNSVPYDFDGK